MRACDDRLQPFESFGSDSYEGRVRKPPCRVWCPVQGDDFYKEFRIKK